MAEDANSLGAPTQEIITRANEKKSVLTRESKRIDQLVAHQFTNTILAWEAPLYSEKIRPKWWYVAIAFVVIGLFLYGLLANAWTLSMLVLVFVGVYYYVDHKPVTTVQTSISEQGITFAGRLYPFTMFQAFWIDFHPPVIKEVHILPNNKFKYELTLQLADQDPAVIRQILRRFIPELVDREKTLMESFSHITGL